MDRRAQALESAQEIEPCSAVSERNHDLGPAILRPPEGGGSILAPCGHQFRGKRRACLCKALAPPVRRSSGIRVLSLERRLVPLLKGRIAPIFPASHLRFDGRNLLSAAVLGRRRGTALPCPQQVHVALLLHRG